jgi:hypothetical protein
MGVQGFFHFAPHPDFRVIVPCPCDRLLYSCAGMDVTRTSTVREIVLRSKVQLINEFQTRLEAYRMHEHQDIVVHAYWGNLL